MPETVESQSKRVAKVRSSSQGLRKPGVWAPWPGATMTSTRSTVPVAGAGAHLQRARTGPPIFVGFLQRLSPTRPKLSGGSVVVGAPRLAPEHEGDLQGERVPRHGRGKSGEVRDLPEPVAHRVGVHEQRAGGTLQR